MLENTFKFQYDNTLSQKKLNLNLIGINLNSNMIIL